VLVRRQVSRLTCDGGAPGDNAPGNGTLEQCGRGDELGIGVEAKDGWFKGSGSAIA